MEDFVYLEKRKVLMEALLENSISWCIRVLVEDLFGDHNWQNSVKGRLVRE